MRELNRGTLWQASLGCWVAQPVPARLQIQFGPFTGDLPTAELFKYGTHFGRIARELGVQYVLGGSVRRGANRVRVTAQLIQVKDQTHLSTGRQFGEPADVAGSPRSGGEQQIAALRSTGYICEVDTGDALRDLDHR